MSENRQGGAQGMEHDCNITIFLDFDEEDELLEDFRAFLLYLLTLQYIPKFCIDFCSDVYSLFRWFVLTFVVFYDVYSLSIDFVDYSDVLY